jgi:hypothetical protein
MHSCAGHVTAGWQRQKVTEEKDETEGREGELRIRWRKKK